MGACGVLDDGSFKEVVAKGFVKPAIDDIVLVLIMVNALVELVIVMLDKLVTIQCVDTAWSKKIYFRYRHMQNCLT